MHQVVRVPEVSALPDSPDRSSPARRKAVSGRHRSQHGGVRGASRGHGDQADGGHLEER